MNKKHSLLLILLIGTILLYAKDKDKKDSDRKEFNRLYIGVSVTPNMGFRLLNKNFVPAGSSDAEVRGVLNYANNRDFPQVGVSAGLKGGVYITRWLAIETGIQYSLIRYKYSADRYYNDSVYTGHSNFNAADSFTTVDKNVYHYVKVPLSLNFSMGRKKVRGILSLGVDFDFLIRKTLHYTYSYSDGVNIDHTVVDNYNNFHKFNVSPFLGIGADFYFNQSFALRIMPVAQIQALKNTSTPITEYLYSIGLNVSFLIGFLKTGG